MRRRNVLILNEPTLLTALLSGYCVPIASPQAISSESDDLKLKSVPPQLKSVEQVDRSKRPNLHNYRSKEDRDQEFWEAKDWASKTNVQISAETAKSVVVVQKMRQKYGRPISRAVVRELKRGN